MDRKRLIFIISLTLVGGLIIAGVVLFLRSRALPFEGTLLQRSKSETRISPDLPPYTKIEDMKKAPPYVPGQGQPPPIEDDGRDPTLGVENES